MNKTSIAWTTFSANPLKYRRKSDGKVVWGCIKTSPGCAHCYSEALALRYNRGKLFNAANMEELEPFLDEGELHKMLTAKTVGGVQVSGSRCFVGDMSDVFGPWVPDALLDRLFAVFALRADVTWQLLTKRAERMRDYFAAGNRASRMHRVADDMARDIGRPQNDAGGYMVWPGGRGNGLPIPNVHLGVSVENRHCADERIPLLLQTPATVRFLSCEPLLGPVDLRGECNCLVPSYEGQGHEPTCAAARVRPISWCIVGGESGPGFRPMNHAWAIALRDQCRAAGIPFFFKQSSGARSEQGIVASTQRRQSP
jgi:protein gp37